MKPLRAARAALALLAVTGLVAQNVVGQIVPQQKTPPLLKGEKKKKDDDGKTRSLSGTVKDAEDNPVVGAVVQLKDMKSLQVRSFITKEDGVYHFYGLSSDVDYQIKADFNRQSSGVKTLSTFDSRRIAIINLKIEPKK